MDTSTPIPPIERRPVWTERDLQVVTRHTIGHVRIIASDAIAAGGRATRENSLLFQAEMHHVDWKFTKMIINSTRALRVKRG